MLDRYEINITGDTPDKDNETFFCSICSYPLLNKDDFFTNIEYLCCHDCYLQFVEARKSTWKKGMRPKQKLLNNYLKQKKLIFEKLGDKCEF